MWTVGISVLILNFVSFQQFRKFEQISQQNEKLLQLLSEWSQINSEIKSRIYTTFYQNKAEDADLVDESDLLSDYRLPYFSDSESEFEGL